MTHTLFILITASCLAAVATLAVKLRRAKRIIRKGAKRINDLRGSAKHFQKLAGAAAAELEEAHARLAAFDKPACPWDKYSELPAAPMGQFKGTPI